MKNWQKRFYEKFKIEQGTDYFVATPFKLALIEQFIAQEIETALNKERKEIKKLVQRAVKETEKEHGSPNIFIDMVGETIFEDLENRNQ